MLIAVLQHGSCLRRDRSYGMIRSPSMWAVGESTHHEADDEHLLGLGLLVRDEARDARGRHAYLAYGTRFLPAAVAWARLTALSAALSAAS